MKANVIPESTPRPLTREVIMWEFDALLRRLCASSVRQYKRSADRFREYLKMETIEDALFAIATATVTSAQKMILDWRNTMFAGKADTTIRKQAVAIFAFLKHLNVRLLLPWRLRLTDFVPGYTRKRKPPLETTAHDATIRRLRKYLSDTTSDLNFRDRVLISLLYEVLLYPSEIVQLRVGDVDLGNRLLRVSRTQGAREKVSMPVSGPVIQELDEWLQLVNGRSSDPLIVACLRGSVSGARRGVDVSVVNIRLANLTAKICASPQSRPTEIRMAGIMNVARLCGENKLSPLVGMTLCRIYDPFLFRRYMKEAAPPTCRKLAELHSADVRKRV